MINILFVPNFLFQPAKVLLFFQIRKLYFIIPIIFYFQCNYLRI